MFVKDGELALWVTERSQLPNGEWRIMVWLNTKDGKLSNHIHKRIADLVKLEMDAATVVTDLKFNDSDTTTNVTSESPDELDIKPFYPGFK